MPFGGCGSIGLLWPSRNTPVTGFRQKAYLDTYSGGTVRDSHPILLFSIPGHTPDLPHIGLSICQKHYNTAPKQNQVEAAGKEIAVCQIDCRTLAPRVYEGGGAQRRGEYAAGCYEFASVFGELETIYRMGSPRPSGTPLINAGGKGAVQLPDKSEFD